MEILWFNRNTAVQRWLSVLWHCAPSSPSQMWRCNAKTKDAHRPVKRRTDSDLSRCWKTRNGPGLVVQLFKKCCCLKKMRKSPLLNVSVTCFYWKFHHTPLSLSGCEHSHAPWCPLAPTWLQSARARVEHYTHRESASSFSFSVCMCECESDFSLSDLYSLLPAIASSLTQPPDVLLCTPTPWCYISRLVWTACVVRPEWNDDMTVSYRCRHVVILCLYSQLAPNELWLKWWYRISCRDLLYPLYQTLLFHKCIL